MKCDAIIIIAKPEQIPYLKLRYGDVAIDISDVNLNVTREPLSSQKRHVCIYYVSVAQKYVGLDTANFAMHHIANLFSQATKESFGFIAPTTYFICQPWNAINPKIIFDYRQSIRQARYDAKMHSRCYFEFKVLNQEQNKLSNLGDRSHILLFSHHLLDVWKLLKEMYITSNKSNIRKSKFSDFHPETINFHPFIVNHNDYYNLQKWSEYVRLMNDMQSIDTTSIFAKYEDLIMKSNLKFMPNMKNIDEFDVWNDLTFDNLTLSTVESKNFKRWKQKREKLRTRNPNDLGYNGPKSEK